MKTHEVAARLRAKLKARGGARGKRFEPALKAQVVRFAECWRSLSLIRIAA